VDYYYEASHLFAEDDEDSPETRAFAQFLRDTHFHMSQEATPFPLEVQFPYRIVSKAQEWIATLDAAKEDSAPFLMWLSFPEPHNPFQVPEPYYSLFPPEDLPPTVADESALPVKGFKYQWCRNSFIAAFPNFAETLQRARANYMGMLRLIDDQVRRFVDFLDEQSLSDNTIVIFMSDHGDFVGEYGLMRKGPELPESLVRIPFSFTGPGIVVSEDPHPAYVSIVDLLPTLCEAANIAQPDGVQGRSFWPLLTGQPYPEEEFTSVYMEHGFGGLYYTGEEDLDPADDGLFVSPDGTAWGGYDCLNSWTQSGQMRGIRKGEWKLCYDMQGNGQLYHLPDDPSELKNLFGRPETAQVQAELMADLMTWILRTQDPLPLPRRRYVMKTDPRNYWTPYL
jgi:arylsulfatase A-like enzyme